MDTCSLFLALAGDLDECIFLSKPAEWIEMRSKDCRDDFRADEKSFFSTVLAALNIRNMTRENQYCSRRRSDDPTCYACVVKPIALMIVKNKSINLPVKD